MRNTALAEDSREPTGAISAEPARIKLQPLGTPLRAQARAHTDGRLVLEAELPWLQLGAACTAELSDGRSVEGTVHWIGLDMTRSGTARLRILVNTSKGQSIQLSVSDADVQELIAIKKPRKRRPFRWMLPIVTAMLAGAAGWLGSSLLTVKPQMLAAAPEAPAAPRVMAPLRVVKIPVESAPIVTQPEIAVVMTPTVAPALPAIVPLAQPEVKTQARPAKTPVRKILRKRR